jgi:integrase
MAKAFDKLTRPAIRKVAPGGKINEHGITFERLPNGDGVFTVNVMVDSQRIHRVIGRESDGTTRTQAEDFIEKARTEARQGRLNLPKGRKMALEFAQAALAYLDKLAEEGGKNIAKKRQHLTDHLVPFFNDKPLAKVSSFDVERYKKARLEAGIKPGTLNRELATLSHLFNKTVEWKWIAFKPATIKRLEEDKGRITYLTTEQMGRMIEAAKKDQNWQVYPFIVIGLETSMRRMEILSIRLEHIDLARRVIYIPKAKAGSREQPITAHVAEFLKGYIDAAEPEQGWLFPSRSEAGHTKWIEKP